MRVLEDEQYRLLPSEPEGLLGERLDRLLLLLLGTVIQSWVLLTSRDRQHPCNQRGCFGDLGGSPCKQDFELVQLGFGSVVPLEVGGALKLFDDWVEGGVDV